MSINLSFDCLDHTGMAMPQTAYGNTGNKISKSPTIRCIYKWALRIVDLQPDRRIACLCYMLVKRTFVTQNKIFICIFLCLIKNISKRKNILIAFT